MICLYLSHHQRNPHYYFNLSVPLVFLCICFDRIHISPLYCGFAVYWLPFYYRDCVCVVLCPTMVHVCRSDRVKVKSYAFPPIIKSTRPQNNTIWRPSSEAVIGPNIHSNAHTIGLVNTKLNVTVYECRYIRHNQYCDKQGLATTRAVALIILWLVMCTMCICFGCIHSLFGIGTWAWSVEGIRIESNLDGWKRLLDTVFMRTLLFGVAPNSVVWTIYTS